VDAFGLIISLAGAVLAYLQVASNRRWWPFAHRPEYHPGSHPLPPRPARSRARTRSVLRGALALASVVIVYGGIALVGDFWPFADSGSGTRGDPANRTVDGGGCSAIQAMIDALPQTGGSVTVRPGTYVCTRSIVIDRDDVTLRGNGPSTFLKLGDHVNRPVLVIGQAAAAPSRTRRGIRVSDLSIDGNRVQQDYECSRGPCAGGDVLRNNGLSLRRVENVVVERVSVKNVRSDGLTTELGSRRVTVRELTVTGSFVDGVAGYETEDSRFSDLLLRDNGGAGLSFDLGFNNNLVRDTVIERSRDVGIFMRHAAENIFTGVRVRDSGGFGIFLAQVDADSFTPARGNSFDSVVVARSGRDPSRNGYGMRVNDQSCVDNVVVGSQFVDNRDGAISEARPGLVKQSGTITR
jgi:hypothetical protein